MKEGRRRLRRRKLKKTMRRYVWTDGLLYFTITLMNLIVIFLRTTTFHTWQSTTWLLSALVDAWKNRFNWDWFAGIEWFAAFIHVSAVIRKCWRHFGIFSEIAIFSDIRPWDRERFGFCQHNGLVFLILSKVIYIKMFSVDKKKITDRNHFVNKFFEWKTVWKTKQS